MESSGTLRFDGAFQHWHSKGGRVWSTSMKDEAKSTLWSVNC